MCSSKPGGRRHAGSTNAVCPPSLVHAHVFCLLFVLVTTRSLNKERKKKTITLSCSFTRMYVCQLITLTRSPKAELRRAQLNRMGRMHMKGASSCRQTVMNDPRAQQPSQMTWVKTRPQHRELHALLLTNSVWVL